MNPKMKLRLPKGMKYTKDVEVWVNVVIEQGMDEYGRTTKRILPDGSSGNGKQGSVYDCPCNQEWCGRA